MHVILRHRKRFGRRILNKESGGRFYFREVPHGIRQLAGSDLRTEEKGLLSSFAPAWWDFMPAFLPGTSAKGWVY